MKYLAVAPRAWGKGDTIAEALDNCRMHFSGDEPGAEAIVHEAPDGSTVDGLGRISYPRDADSEPEKVGRRTLYEAVAAEDLQTGTVIGSDFVRTPVEVVEINPERGGYEVIVESLDGDKTEREYPPADYEYGVLPSEDAG